MKIPRYLLFFFLLCGPAFAQGQWSQQQTPTTEALNAVHFVDADEGWAVGTNGTILHTSDGGSNWSQQSTPISHQLRSVHFADSSHGWAVGSFGTILYTSDGGTNWVTQDTIGNPGISLHSVFAVSPTEAWASGDSLVILHTSDGGSIWNLENQGSNSRDISDLYFRSSSYGWATGPWGTPRSTFLRTEDGGTNWDTVEDTLWDYCQSVHFVSDSEGWMGGPNGYVLHTVDSGNSWVEQPIGESVATRDLYFSSASKGWAVGYNGKIFHTSDGGASWNTQSTGTSEDLLGVHFINDSTGWAAGVYGTILHTENGGLSGIQARSSEPSWSVHPSPTTGRIQVELEEVPDQVRYELRSLQGELLRSGNASNSRTLELSIEQDPGLYFLRVRSDDQEKVFKVVKE